MDFDEADRFGGRYGNQFIAELGPHFPLYADLLPPAARAALGRPHAQSRPAYDMLLAEGFRDEGYIDVFRSEEHTSELQSLMRISYAVFCLQQQNRIAQTRDHIQPAQLE